MSKLTSKYQATIPAPVRAALRLQKGDSVAFEIREDGCVSLRKAAPLDLEFPPALQPLLSEWASPDDEEAYRGL